MPGSESSSFECAMARFDQENAQDPNVEMMEGAAIPRELAYARRLSEWVVRLDPNASEALRLAARCQHIRRWEVPRSSFSGGRAGYHKWKNHLKQFHAEISRRILRECGYAEEMVRRVQELNLKANFPDDPDTRTLEDALCLVFLEHQFAALVEKTEPEKVVNALRKSWVKMTPAGRKAALELSFSPREKELLALALERSQNQGAT